MLLLCHVGLGGSMRSSREGGLRGTGTAKRWELRLPRWGASCEVLPGCATAGARIPPRGAPTTRAGCRGQGEGEGDVAGRGPELDLGLGGCMEGVPATPVAVRGERAVFA